MKTTDRIWASVYEHILLNPKNYYIQVADSSGHITWKSQNLREDSIPIPLRCGLDFANGYASEN